MFKGDAANELREIHAMLNRGRDKDIARAKAKVEELTHELERDAWDETRPMSHVPSGGAQ